MPAPDFRSKCEAILPEVVKIDSVGLLQEPIDLLRYHDYKIRIPYPMVFSIIRKKLFNGGASSAGYQHHNEFALDMRLVFGNFFRYNYVGTRDDFNLRKNTLRMLHKFEKLWLKMEEEVNSKLPPSGDPIHLKATFALLHVCIQASEDIFRASSIHNFIHYYRTLRS